MSGAPYELTSGKQTPALLIGVFGVFLLASCGPFLYEWFTTPWAHPVLRPASSLTGEWVGPVTLDARKDSTSGSTNKAASFGMKMTLHLNFMSMSRATHGNITLCDGQSTSRYKVIGGILQEGRYSAFTRSSEPQGMIGSLDGVFVPGTFTVQSGSTQGVLHKGTDDDFDRLCASLRN